MPTFHKGLNVTVRCGTSKYFSLRSGDTLHLTDDDYQPICNADVVFVHLVELSEIPFVWLKYEHNEAARTYCGLRDELIRLYGDEFVEAVTVIGFDVEKDYRPKDPSEAEAPGWGFEEEAL